MCEPTEAVVETLHDPRATLERIAALLESYWALAFVDEWPQLEAQLALARAEAELHLAAGGIGALLARTTRRARLAGDALTIRPSIPVDVEIPMEDGQPLPVVLSLFAAPHVFTLVGGRAALVIPAPAADNVTAPSLELVRGLNAIADPTRLTLLRLVAAAPRSTRELAQLLELSESTVSKHMRQLADADLVRGARQGYYVLYRLVPERAEAASAALREFLLLGTDSPPG
jgi:DNA-binding transcriptional ArsR family regulator